MTKLINWLIKKFNLNVSDGYHTFDELYEFRMLYNAAFFKHLFFSHFPVHKSLRHCDGELCFGGGWFIVVAKLPTGVISNHYKIEHWDLFNVPSFYKSIIPYDGHTPQDVVKRLIDYCKGSEEVATGSIKKAIWDTLGGAESIFQRPLTPSEVFHSPKIETQTFDDGMTVSWVPNPHDKEQPFVKPLESVGVVLIDFNESGEYTAGIDHCKKTGSSFFPRIHPVTPPDFKTENENTTL